MTTPSANSPLRVAGVVLLGIAVVTGLIGFVSLGVSGGSTEQTAAPAAPSVTTVPPEPTPTAQSSPEVAATETPQATFAPGDGLAAPPQGASPPQPPQPATSAPVPAPAGVRSGGTGGAASAAVTRAPIRVYNNSTIKGLASRAAADFRRAGWRVDEVGNYPHGIIPTSTVYFTPGTAEEAAAQALGREFGLRVEPRFEGIRNASPGLIVIVTRDYGT